jgi:hypothetical protein
VQKNKTNPYYLSNVTTIRRKGFNQDSVSKFHAVHLLIIEQTNAYIVYIALSVLPSYNHFMILQEYAGAIANATAIPVKLFRGREFVHRVLIN